VIGDDGGDRVRAKPLEPGQVRLGSFMFTPVGGEHRFSSALARSPGPRWRAFNAEAAQVSRHEAAHARPRVLRPALVIERGARVCGVSVSSAPSVIRTSPGGLRRRR
jgi:hypothetical protein